MRTFSKGLVVLLFGTMLGLAACDQQGPMEKAGENVDEAVDEMTGQGPMEEAGENVDEAWDEAKEAGRDVGDSMDGDNR